MDKGTSDFNPADIIKSTNQHDKDIGYLKRKINELDSRVGDDAKFAECFASSQRNSTILNETINTVIDQHDSHLLVVKGATLIKWLAVLFIGGIMGWFVNQMWSIPKYSSELEALRMQVEKNQN